MAKYLRKDMSLPERMLWARLRGRKDGRPTFRRQHPMGHFVLDFYCPSARLAIEVDGAAHGDTARAARDRSRDAWLKKNGVRVVRIPAWWVLEQPDAMAERAKVLAENMIEQRNALSRARPPFTGDGPPVAAGEGW